MTIDWQRAMAFAVLGAALAVGIGIVLVAFHGVRGVLRWTFGRDRPKTPKTDVRPEPGPRDIGAFPVSAADLYAIRANLDVASRQLENLERRLNLAPAPRPRETERTARENRTAPEKV